MNSGSKTISKKNSAGSASETGTGPAQEDTPRDVRLLHLLLASQSIHQYEDQVPLQLMDFAHRYTQGVLKDALVYNDYAGSSNTAGSSLGVEDIRLAIAARTQYQFKPTAPKELMLQLAAERNKKALPQVMGTWGVRLPPEKYCLTAKEWDLEDSEST
ncbi:hypothetical protein SKDZ_13G3620 [Saccharomyces kudriavzevii ZP591]|uniref:TAF9-like protein n=3 Tax=Saccharomyces TaxID=4930 RepID=J6EEM5_SACK1|nr:uncharacterized protein SKDI_13G3660 [Saccharomyces kudriavzevii IFO 1802]EHN00731.1 Taf9p [Saccharomyces cerevisiae x Saccharomyces kudriavzevii VIN7]EJT42604.1 TAF9-like protein [Saccharomyces kudriavzevii IFO 1802]CAI4048759.1 hypothetical protein SKDI_13G3660 [Saccharomyces kudriavzevii IFO 1802]CAI4048763.1 hypothetical protein SKDZ_13G3620 [Saccharomyces kudriavzevii ZP591]